MSRKRGETANMGLREQNQYFHFNLPQDEDEKRDYAIFGEPKSHYEFFESATIVRVPSLEKKQGSMTLPPGISGLGSVNNNNKNLASILSKPWKAFSQKHKKNNPVSPASNNLIENTDYQRSEVDLEPEIFTIPDCKFPSPTGPVGIPGFKIVNVETNSDNSDQDIQYEINDKENDYEEIDTLQPSPLVEMIAIPQIPTDTSLPYYGSYRKEKRAAPEPEPEPTEPTEDYMDMEGAKELLGGVSTRTTPTSHIPPLAATAKITKRDSELKTALLAHMNKVENNKVSKVAPPIRKTICNLTVHSHSLSILREEYQNTTPEPPKRVTSLSTNEESGFIKEIKEELKGKSSVGYEKVPNFKSTKPNIVAKPKVAIPKTELVTKNGLTEVAITNDKEGNIEKSRSRTKSMKILNTDLSETNLDKPPSPTKKVPLKREENTIFSHSPISEEHCVIPANLNKPETQKNAIRCKPKIPTPEEQDFSPNKPKNYVLSNDSPKPPTPTEKAPPKKNEKPIQSLSPLSDLRSNNNFSFAQLKSRISNIEVKLNQNSAEPAENIPSKLVENREKRKNTVREKGTVSPQLSDSDTNLYKPEIPTPDEQDFSPNKPGNIFYLRQDVLSNDPLKPSIPTKNALPQKNEKPMLSPSPESGDLAPPLKSRISNIEVKLDQNYAEPAENIPSKLIENRKKRKNTIREKGTVSPQLSDSDTNLYKPEIPTPDEQDFSPNKSENISYLRQDVLSNDPPKPPTPTKKAPPKKNEKPMLSPSPESGDLAPPLKSRISNIEVKLDQNSAEPAEHIPSKLIENREKRKNNTEIEKRTLSPQLSDSDTNLYKPEIPTPDEQDFSPNKPGNIFYLRQDVLSNDPLKPSIPTKNALPQKNEKPMLSPSPESGDLAPPLKSRISNIEVKLDQNSAEPAEHIPSKLIENMKNRRNNTEIEKRTLSPQLSDSDTNLYKPEIPTPDEQDFSPNKPGNIFYLRQDVLSNDPLKPSIPTKNALPQKNEKPMLSPSPESGDLAPPLKSRISNIEVKLDQNSAEPAEHIPSKLIENMKNRRNNTEIEKRTLSPQLSDSDTNLHKQEIPTPDEQDFSPNKPENIFYLRQDVLSNDPPKPPTPTKKAPDEQDYWKPRSRDTERERPAVLPRATAHASKPVPATRPKPGVSPEPEAVPAPGPKHGQKPIPATGPKPKRTNSCKTILSGDDRRSNSITKDEFTKTPLKFSNELQRQLEKMNVEPNYYV